MNIGQRIKELRIKKGMTQQQLAKACKWSLVKEIKTTKRRYFYDKGQARISSYERNVYEPSLDQLTILAKVFKVSISSFLEEV